MAAFQQPRYMRYVRVTNKRHRKVSFFVAKCVIVVTSGFVPRFVPRGKKQGNTKGQIDAQKVLWDTFLRKKIGIFL